ncbi:hypothetical protein [Pseudoalteromonas luteoviolacea]|uniref:hypothetical protein n=1 Tax=Pseudoalteromonas luteoviolacea TaxID=43657 RepID=UPI00114F3ED1|nr:hypothetical protein [Pseudoalteromonas luteoviolacea]TQF71802.1 hypothetical protein FLM44_12270 [Pseudoalteromonas luteoviolacea]
MLSTEQLEQIENNLFELSEPLVIEGKEYKFARKTTEPKVIHRIKGSRFCKSEFGEENSDGVMVGVAAQVIEFGTADAGELFEPRKFDAMTLCENLSYRDMVAIQYLMGKPLKVLSTSKAHSSEQQSKQS